ncbi:MAG TPA: zinc-dependent metalloprotease, partial [Longimicrobiaceae bacterium]|nr:zinc-dependent metalloprotease [Longimicrobiaceae bacterium]
MTRRRTLVAALAVLAACAPAQRPAGSPAPSTGTAGQTAAAGTIAQKTAGLERHDGYFPFYYDAKAGKLLLEVPRVGEDFLYLNSLATGIGSNALGLDRGTTGSGAVVRWERHGPKLLLVQQNTAFRAGSGDPGETRAVEESFATSVRGAFPVLAEEGGRVLVDATDFFLQDAFGVAAHVRRSQQGDFRLDRDRSTIYLPRTKAFPKNTEVEALLTWAGENPGPEIQRHTPDGRSLTLRQHHSFVELPPPGYRPRAFDPRVGVNPLVFYDFSQPFDARYPQRWISRWRLEKKDPSAAMSEPVKPIVYYLDPGVPEPYRTAFREGATWWNRVFEAAGFIDAFRVEDLPEGADPMDARYSVIQWVHRTDPGFSVGPSFRDPRTGEIIKAAVRMDSYRSLTDYNIFAGALPAMMVGDWVGRLDPRADAEAFAMARRRQHVAHEVGHTLGLAHNFVASAEGRSSVMDYPGPLIRLRDGRIDVSDAYRAGPGAYDTLAIRYAYTQFATPEEEARALAALAAQATREGVRFLSDRDAGEDGSMAEVTRWALGSDRVAELERTMEVRRVLLDRFGAEAIRPGEPMWHLSERLAPVYLHHRYALEAAIKTVGGLEYTYAVAGDGQAPATIVDPAEQRRALDALVRALQPEALAIPERVAALVPPPPFGYAATSWSFASPLGGAFDPLAAAQALAATVADGVLHRERAARLVSFHARNPAAPSLHEVTTRLVQGTWGRPTPASPRDAALRRAAQRATLDALIGLAADPRATAQ